MSRWRVGRKLGRTLYRDERFVGICDDVNVAQMIVDAMNGGFDRTLAIRMYFAIEFLQGLPDTFQYDEIATLLKDVERALGGVPCRWCNGTGKSDEIDVAHPPRMKVCGLCNGSGFVRKEGVP